MKKIFALAILAASLGMTGCATVVSKTTQEITVDSNPSGLNYSVTNGNGAIVAQGITPATVILKRGEGSETIKIKDNEGRLVGTGTLTENLNGWVFGNIFIGGIIGAVVDSVDGAAWKYSPDHLVVGTTAHAGGYYGSAPVDGGANSPFGSKGFHAANEAAKREGIK